MRDPYKIKSGSRESGADTHDVEGAGVRMVQIAPKELASQVQEQTNAFMRKMTRYDSYNEFELQRLLRDVDRLKAVDVVEANCIQAMLYSITGREGLAEQALSNADRNNGGVRVLYRRTVLAANSLRAGIAAGYASQALSAGPTGEVGLVDLVSAATSVGAFNMANEAIDRSIAGGLVVAMTNLIRVIRDGAGALTALGLNDAAVLKAVDQAGAVLRSRGLIWLNDFPDVSILPSSCGGPAVSMVYRVHVSPGEATELTWELFQRQIDNDAVVDGVSVSFIGTDLPSDELGLGVSL